MKIGHYLRGLNCVFFLLLVFVSKAQNKDIAENHLVARSNEEVYSIVKKLTPGSVLELADGVYKDIKLVVTRSGEAGKPVCIKAVNPGRVFFTGDAKVEMRGEYLILAGIFFKDGNRNIAQWKSHGPGLVAVYGSHNRVTECVFDFFDEANSAYITTSLTEDGKVPQHCRIDHCVFTDKITFDQVINLNNTYKAMKDGRGGPPMYHRVDHCFFSNPPKPGNSGGGIRIGYYQNDVGRCLIDSNLFMRQDSEAEIITSKSTENVFYNNTYLNCQGTMNFRHGDNQVAINNFYIGNDTKYEYGGMFVWGSKHIIACNYFELPGTIKSRGNAALMLNPGADRSEHALFHTSLIINNAFINTNGYAINFNAMDERRKEFSLQNKLRFEAPHHLTLKGNIFYSEKNQLFPFFKDDYHVGSNVWENNFARGKTGIEISKGIKQINLTMERSARGIYVIQPESSYKLSKVNSVKPVEGITLNLNDLINKGIQGRPLSWEDVKPGWIKDMPGTYSHSGSLSSERAKRLKEVIKRNKEASAN